MAGAVEALEVLEVWDGDGVALDGIAADVVPVADSSDAAARSPNPGTPTPMTTARRKLANLMGTGRPVEFARPP
jgi:hypothetical protein